MCVCVSVCLCVCVCVCLCVIPSITHPKHITSVLYSPAAVPSFFTSFRSRNQTLLMPSASLTSSIFPSAHQPLPNPYNLSSPGLSPYSSPDTRLPSPWILVYFNLSLTDKHRGNSLSSSRNWSTQSINFAELKKDKKKTGKDPDQFINKSVSPSVR